MSDLPIQYYDLPRADVVAAIPAHVRNVLDVGCGGGGLGRELKRHRPNVAVRGIEIVADQAERARANLDDVMCGTLDAPLPAHWPRPDCVVFADVLEHLVDPWAAVRRARELLTPGGFLVASIPNIAHASIIADLLRGRFDYQSCGILDRTHLRFFTRPTAIALVESGGFEVREVRRNLDPTTQQRDQRFHGPIGRVLAFEKSRDRLFRGVTATLADAVTIQFLIVAS